VDEFLLVKFPESRQLVLNGFTQGRTNMVTRLEAGTYKVELAGQKNYSPDSQTVTLRFTAITSPAVVTFHVLPPSAVTPDVTAGRA
jgi:hypothetical protein